MAKRTWIWTPVLLIALAAASYVVYLWLTPAGLPQGILYGNGHIEGTEVTVASQATGRVTASNLVEGTVVRTGTVLVQLDETDLRAQLARAQAERELALAERSRLKSEVATARHHLANAEIDDRRAAALQRDGVMPAARREQVSNLLAEAQSRVATLSDAISASDARVRAAEEGVVLARSQLEKATIVAPISGTILVKSIEVGELATPGRAITTLVDLAHLQLKVYVPERDIGKLRFGNEARVRTDAFPERFASAQVSRIDSQAQFTPRDIHMPDERVRLVFGVTLAIDNPQGRLKPGMPADAWIRWNPTVPWPSPLRVPR